MSSPEALAPMVFSAQELLAFNEDQLVQFLNDSRTKSGGFDISRVVGVDGLSKGQREEFSRKLSAAAVKAGPLNINELSRLLGIFAGHDRTSDAPSRSRSRHVRSPTSSPPPEGNSRFEAFCHDELVEAGGRPVVPIELLLHTSKDAEVDRENFGPWLDDTLSRSRDGDVLPVFSTQLEDWMSFQHKWQWDNRGKYAGDEGFSASLESRRRRYLHKGELEMVSDPSFEAMARQIWKYEPRFLELSGKEGFTAYTHAVEKRLASHNFTQPFRLAKDPRQQDAWTTWVEYLNYVYWWRDRYAAEMKASELQYRKAWDELQRFNASPSSSTSSTTGTLDEEISATRFELEATRQQIRKFIRGTKVYQRREMAVCRQELRAQWVLEQLPLIETTPSLEHEAAKNDSSASSSKKRKLRDDQDNLARQQPKRMGQEVSHSGSIPDPEPKTGNGSGTAMPNERAATSTSTTANSKPRQEALLSKPQTPARRTRKQN
ncbi:hypothetical protein Egran_00105 [Elaphomyces granulatus]|uniref:Uncharacterized protein n=1 Tax=Elaphomyces granulatus TaxID=519963 RepID=A0A232M6U1_9EURO|nr:hypothetical protein Egran_00105 [Elaphomyces granulatus]